MNFNKKHRLILLCLLCALCCLAATVKAEEPLRILFIGNSFTIRGPIPEVVRDLAMNAGWAAPDVRQATVSGKTLEFHSSYIPTLADIDEGGWDYVVLQEYSTRPTDNIGDPEAFKFYATFLYDRVKLSSPDAQIILYETWARHEDHDFYPDSFEDRDEMQEQLNYHYHDCADNYIPANSTAAIKTDVRVARVGEAWHVNYHNRLDGLYNVMLHSDDLYHGDINGQYLSSMVIYSTIYHRMVIGLNPLLGISEADASYMQDICDAVTGETIPQVGDDPVTIADVIDFFDISVADDSIVGIKKGKVTEEDREAMFRDILIEAEDLIANEMEACRTLNEAIRACDGVPNPPDYIEGDGVGELISKIEELMIVLDCN
jgi:hypothetical protein